jgi:hypothetical protein
MNKIEMILELSWLKIFNSDINWTFQTWHRKIDARSSRAFSNFRESQIAIVSANVFKKFCMRNESQTYLVQATMLSRSEDISHESFNSNNLVKMKLSSQYSDLAEVFNEFVTNLLSKHDSQNLAIDTQKISSSFESFYNFSENEFKMLRKYLNKYLKNEFIISSKSICAASILFIKKNTSELRLCVDYRELNALIVKNRYLFSLISEMLNRIIDVKYFIKLNIIAAYNKIRIKKKNEWKTAFRTCYDMYEYRVVSFELVNASTAFQTYINVALREYLDVFALAYIDDIFIFFKILKKHEKHMRVVLERLLQYKLYVDIKKLEFSVIKTSFLKFIISREDVEMNSNRIETIVDWSKSQSHKNVQIFLYFANFYIRFIEDFSRVAFALCAFLKENDKDKFHISVILTSKTRKFLKKFRKIFLTSFLLRHFDSDRKIKLKTNASKFAILRIISQLNETFEQWHFVAYWFRKMTFAERNYDAEKSKMLAMMKACKQWRYYVENAKH